MDLESAYDPQRFRELGHALVDQLSDELSQARSAKGPVLAPVDPDALLEQWSGAFSARGGAAIDEILRQVWQHSVRVHHPGYVGHQVAAPLPMAALVELASALSNNGMAVYEMGQVPTVVERRVIEFLSGQLRLGPEADGVRPTAARWATSPRYWLHVRPSPATTCGPTVNGRASACWSASRRTTASTARRA